jgi:hypothetical protein
MRNIPVWRTGCVESSPIRMGLSRAEIVLEKSKMEPGPYVGGTRFQQEHGTVEGCTMVIGKEGALDLQGKPVFVGRKSCIRE